MHTFTETGAGVPAFLAKLWRLVEDSETNNLICWSKDGRSFIIQNQAQFARELLPLNYKHNNMASFIRQLNMYGFHKITSIDNGGLKFDRDEMEFTHPCFKRNCPYLLEHIKRKIASAKVVDEKTTIKPEAVSKVLQDVKAMRGRQDSLDSRFSVMKQENEALWREIASLRQKHAKQQQIVNKLIQFLITIVQPQRNMTGVKRHMQLMINDNPENAAKLRKTSEGEMNCGPVIHELSEELLDEVADVEPELIRVPNSPFEQTTIPSQSDTEIAASCSSPQNPERPQSSVSVMSQTYDCSNQSTEDSMGFGNNNANNNNNNNDNSANSGKSSHEALVQAVGPDGLKIFYHVTEVPDAQPQDSTPALPANYNDENVLTTPMVREEMARTQLLKQKNRQRRQRVSTSSTSSSPLLVGRSELKKPRLTSSKGSENENSTSINLPKFQPIQVKSEQDIDPMIFLNVYPENRGLTPDSNLISPNFSEDSRQSLVNLTADIFGSTSPHTSSTKAAVSTNSGDLYNPNNFIVNDIPADIFEDSSIISSPSDNSTFSGDSLKLARQQKQRGCTPLSNDKFSSHLGDNSTISISNGIDINRVNNNNGASTSAAAIAANTDDSDSNNQHSVVLPSTSKGAGAAAGGTSNDIAMAVTKYTNNKGNNEDSMRLSTANDVSGHLDNVQDELDTLKDLLRSDVYSLDHSTLLGKLLNETVTSNDDLNPMGFNNKSNINNTIEHINRILLTPGALDGDNLNKLFNDSEILGTYGLAFSGDNSNVEKKGSELMACHPMYDLSDIINDQNDLDARNEN